jgi:hypothetical protein
LADISAHHAHGSALTANAKLQNAMLRERTMAAAENPGGLGQWGAYGQGKSSVDVSGEGCTSEGRCRSTPSGWCAVASDPAHGEVGLSEHDAAVRFVNGGAAGRCFHTTRWHVVTRCGVGREEVLEGTHYEAWLRLVGGRRFRPVFLTHNNQLNTRYCGGEFLCVTILRARNGRRGLVEARRGAAVPPGSLTHNNQLNTRCCGHDVRISLRHDTSCS